jgi:cobalt-zinc-cadmium resistance protein CzcA
MASSLFLSKKVKHKENISDRMMAFLEKLYEPLLQKAIRLKKMVVGITVAVFFITVFIFLKMGW